MRKFTVFAALLSLLTLSVFSGCDSSSDSGTIIPPPPASDTRVGLYKITKIVSTNVIPENYDTSNPSEVLYFDGEMAVANTTLKIEGKYQIAGYAEYTDRPASPANKYITYNKFSADNVSAANMTLVAGTNVEGVKKQYTLQVTDSTGIALELTVEQQNNSSIASVSYQPWTSAASQGNPYWKNDAFYETSANGRVLAPTRLIGNYMITKAVIEKNGQTNTVESSNAGDLVGELSVTAQIISGRVKLDIVIKLQTNPAKTAATNFKPFVFTRVTDEITLTSDMIANILTYIGDIFINEGMIMVEESDTDIIYSPKKRAADGVAYEDLQIDGAKVTLSLSKIMNGALMVATPAKVLTETEYFVPTPIN